MLLFSELDAPFKRMTRPRLSASTAHNLSTRGAAQDGSKFPNRDTAPTRHEPADDLSILRDHNVSRSVVRVVRGLLANLNVGGRL